MKQVRVLISGRVQGVGFRYWMTGEAERRGLDGWARNLVDGQVEAVFAGEGALVDDMVAACHAGPRFASVARVQTFSHEEPVASGFQLASTGW